MKQSMTQLLGELQGAEEALERTSIKERRVSQDKEALKRGSLRAKDELYKRVWEGESTGNVVDDIIIATTGAPHPHAAEQFRALMSRFAKHRGEFVAGRHLSGRFSEIRVGVISGDAPTFCWSKSEIVLPIAPATVLDTAWQWSYKHLRPGAWTIPINTQDTLSRGRCYALEKLWETDERHRAIHLGDEAVWEFIYNQSKNPLSPLVNCIYLTSALGRPAMTVPAFRAHVEPLVNGLEANIGRLYSARRKLGALTKDILECPGIFSGPINEKIEDAKHAAAENLLEAVRCVQYAHHPHTLQR